MSLPEHVRAVLDEDVLPALRAEPERDIEVFGGTREELEAVRDYLVMQGIPAERIILLPPSSVSD